MKIPILLKMVVMKMIVIRGIILVKPFSTNYTSFTQSIQASALY